MIVQIVERHDLSEDSNKRKVPAFLALRKLIFVKKLHLKTTLRKLRRSTREAQTSTGAA